MTTTASLRKAAIFIRSLDADTAASVLSRLAPAEAKAVRLAIQSLGEVDPDERADVSAEFRRSGTVAQEEPGRGVELDLSSSMLSAASASPQFGSTPFAAARPTSRPFEFLEQARVESLVPYLAREHAQTVAVVLSYLPPARAAQVLAALPEKLQAEAIERLSLLGDTDPSSLQVLERELADWVARQQATRVRPTQRTDTVSAILAAADETSRREILSNLIKHNQSLAEQITPARSAKPQFKQPEPVAIQPPAEPAYVPPAVVAAPRIPQINFDDLARLDQAALTAVMKAVDAEVLVLALVGGSEALVERITAQMPGKIAKVFRQRLHGCGPTRLRDVEAAQHEVASVAAQVIHARLNARQPVVA